MHIKTSSTNILSSLYVNDQLYYCWSLSTVSSAIKTTVAATLLYSELLLRCSNYMVIIM